MQSLFNDRNYENIVSDILSDKDFTKIKEIKHHGQNRLDHSLRVSFYSYKIAKALKLDYISTARAGLLHDFFYEVNEKELITKRLKTLIEHPTYALEKAKSKFELNDKEENIIVSHMFPVSLNLPIYLESWIVDIVDDIVFFSEMYESKKMLLKPALNFMGFIVFCLFKI